MSEPVKTSVWTKRIDEIESAIAADSHTPGGGSVAAMTGAFGCGLVSMATAITERRLAKRAGDPESAAAAQLAELRSLELALSEERANLRELADADIAAFEGYMSALALDRADGSREGALAAALARASEVPARLAEVLARVMELAADAVDRVSPRIVSDVFAGADLTEGAFGAAVRTLESNLTPDQPEARTLELTNRRDAARARVRAARARLDASPRSGREGITDHRADAGAAA